MMTSRISTSLCRIIFQSPKTNDSLLFMTILSTDLKALRQWGYDSTSSATIIFLRRLILPQLVDRILERQKARRQATEKAKLEETEEAEHEETEEAEHEEAEVRSETSVLLISNLPEMTLYDTQAKISITRTNIPLPPAGTVIAAQRPRLTSAIHELGHLLYQNLSNAVSSLPTSPSLEGASMVAQPGPSSELVWSSQPDLTVTSLSTVGMSLETDKSGFHLVFHCI